MHPMQLDQGLETEAQGGSQGLVVAPQMITLPVGVGVARK